MANIKDALANHFFNVAAIATALTNRIYRDQAPPRAASPRLVIHRIGCQRVGACKGPTWVARSLFQLDIIADDGRTAEEVAELIRLALDHYRGTLGTGGNTCHVSGCFFDDCGDDVFPPFEGAELPRTRVRQDLAIYHDERSS